jgi:hypothetical protein
MRQWTIQLPPGAGCGSLLISPPPALARSASESIPQYGQKGAGTASGVVIMPPLIDLVDTHRTHVDRLGLFPSEQLCVEGERRLAIGGS